MKVYRYDKITGEYIGDDEAYLDPLESKIKGTEIYSIPAYCTEIVPIEIKLGFARKFNGTNWEYIEDHRGKIVWKSYTESMTISSVGPIPEGYSEVRPDKPIEDVKKEIVEGIFQLKCKYAYTGIIIIKDNIQHYVETNERSITMWSAKYAIALNPEFNEMINWKTWTAENKSIILPMTKEQFIAVFNFGMNMIDQCFALEDALYREAETTMVSEGFIENKVTEFLENAKTRFDAINKTMTL